MVFSKSKHRQTHGSFGIFFNLNTKAKMLSDNCCILRYFPDESKLELFKEAM